MKKILLTFCCCFVLISAIAQNAIVDLDLTQHIFQGMVTLSGDGFKQTQKCDESKHVVFEVPLEENAFYKLRIDYSTNDLYLVPGSKLNLKVVPNENGGHNILHLNLVFDGETAKINQYLNEANLAKMENIDFVMGEKEYLKKIKETDHANVKRIKSFKLGKQFEKDEIFRTHYELYEAVTRYPVQHFWKDGNDVLALYKTEETPIVNKFIPTEFIDNAKAWKCRAYRKYVNSAIGILSLDDFKVNWDLTAQKRMAVLFKYFKTPCILEDVIQNLALVYVDATHGAPLKSLEEPYKKYVTKAEYHKQLDEAYEVWKNFQKGAEVVSADFAYKDIEGNPVNFSQLKGKYVYVDVWATWCGPCRAEIPHLKQLEEYFRGKNIVFVSISIDSREQDWRKMVKEKEMSGAQWFGGPEAQIAKDYKILSIPRFLLFDKNGQMINSSMSRPSDPGTLKVLEALEGID